LDVLPVADRALGRLRGRTPACERWLAGGEVFAHLGHGAQARFGQLFQNMEFADLVGHVAEHRLQGLGIQGRAVRGHAAQRQAAQLHGHPEASQEGGNVPMIRRVLQHLLQQPFVRVGVHDG
jgi:hypothetical protein